MIPLLPPLGNVDWLDDPGDFIHKGNRSSDVVEDWHISDLFPGHGHVFQQLQNSMGHVLKGTVQEKRKTQNELSSFYKPTNSAQKHSVLSLHVHHNPSRLLLHVKHNTKKYSIYQI